MSSTKQDWTPEPFDQPMPLHETWTQCPNNGYDILISNGDFVGAFVHDDTHSKFSRSRCERAVTCVNALANIPDPAAYIKAMREVETTATVIRDRLAERSSVYWTDKESLDLDAKLKALRTLSTPESEAK